ncbi:MAG: hypothetical protein ABRQ39_28010, partial [Candidatus Eremiobacterota bacterium]
MINTDNIYSSSGSSSLHHHSRQHIDTPENKEQERKKFKSGISLKEHDGKKRKENIEEKRADSSLSSGKTARKTHDEKSSGAGGKTGKTSEKTETKLINIGNTFKELRKAIDNLKTSDSPGMTSGKLVPGHTSLHRISTKSDPAMSHPVTREQKILASLVTGDVKPFFREKKDKDNKNNSPELTGQVEGKENTGRGRSIRQGRRGKKDESRINYFFNPIIPREDSKKKLEEYLKRKYSSARTEGGGEKSRLSAVKPGDASDLKKNDGIPTSLQSPLSRFLNQHGRTDGHPEQHENTKESPEHTESLKTESLKTESLKTESLKTESLKTESLKTES